jgi:alkanesulfonate monooxygenase SsuD/methylene tetrahydromethanopterin reductase-like flavin-dependent oxidoreductase (luciferase family)
MKVGLYLRNMGPQSTRPLIADAARAAEEAGIDDLWVADHRLATGTWSDRASLQTASLSAERAVVNEVTSLPTALPASP